MSRAAATEVPMTPGAMGTFEEFFELEHATLFRALWLVTRDRDEAEEIMQDAFLKLLERWARVAGLDDPTGYLYRTAMNLFRSRRRRAKVALRRVVGGQPRDDLAAVEEREEVIRLLAPLSPRQRAALVMTGLLELSSEEAGRILGISANTVRVLAARARAAVRDRVEEE
jgi:RNA polymerase sigma-70 factor (ECF subfamily)